MPTSAFPSTIAHHGLAGHEVVLLLETDQHRGSRARRSPSAWHASDRTPCPPLRAPGC
ncbi:hypothetical protein ACFQ0O_11060 [Saccharopolyspora spinosporotrichia]